MEKDVKDRLLDAGIELLGTQGSRQATARAVEKIAGVPHGSMRHHFGDQQRYLQALTRHLIELDRPTDGESVPGTLTRWLTAQRTVTRARYELTLLADRDPLIHRHVVAARDAYAAALLPDHPSTTAARFLVAVLDGLVWDALIRGSAAVDHTSLGQLLDAVGLADTAPEP